MVTVVHTYNSVWCRVDMIVKMSIIHLVTFYEAKIHTAIWSWYTIYSGTSIYRSHIDRFPTSTIRHFWSRIKFHINNVIYSRIHHSPNYRFPTFIVCKSPSRHSISCMDRLKKNWSEVFALHSLWTTNLATQ